MYNMSIYVLKRKTANKKMKYEDETKKYNKGYSFLLLIVSDCKFVFFSSNTSSILFLTL